MHLRTLAAPAVVLLAATLVAPPVATADQVENDHYSFTDSHIEQEEHGDDFCGGTVEFPVRYDVTAEGFFHGVRRGDGLVYFADMFRVVESYTNVLNGKSLTQRRAGRYGDVSIVDNRDGTLTITFKFTGRTHVIGPDGDLLFRDVGQLQESIIVDHGGTPGDPDDDEFVEYLGEDKRVGRWDTEGRDFCTDVVELLG
jgi:hypothetical protein